MIEVDLQVDEPFIAAIDPQPLIAAVQVTLESFHHQISSESSATVTVVITDTEMIQQLNHQYLNIDAPTDVLSFENAPDPDFPISETSHLGDIIIAYPVAQAQARAAGHATREEVILLAVHGSLHLAGFDHDTPAERESMWAAQRQIMARLNLAHIQPTET